jgi:hypothetical protein
MITIEKYSNNIRDIFNVVNTKTKLSTNKDLLVEFEYKWYIDIFNILHQLNHTILYDSHETEIISRMIEIIYQTTKQFYTHNDKYRKMMKLSSLLSYNNKYKIRHLKKYIINIIKSFQNDIENIINKQIIFHVNKYDLQILAKKIILTTTLYQHIH